MNINTKGANMAIPSVDLVNQDGLTFRFTYHRSTVFFSTSLLSKPFSSPLVLISSPTCSIHHSSSSSFEVYFSQASFVFPHSEFEKYKAFLAQVKTAKEAA